MHYSIFVESFLECLKSNEQVSQDNNNFLDSSAMEYT